MDIQDPADFIGETVAVRIDRPLGTGHPDHGFLYPVNYGFLPGVASADGEDLDAYVLGVFDPVDEFTGTCVAVLDREDGDHKLIVVPSGTSYSDDQILALTEFQERWHESTVIRNRRAKA